MKTTKRLFAYLCVTAALTQLPHFACQNPMSKDDEMNPLELTALAMAAGNITIYGSYNLYSGTSSTAISGMTQILGVPSMQLTEKQYWSGDPSTAACNPPTVTSGCTLYTGTIIQYDNAQSVYYSQIVSTWPCTSVPCTQSASVGKFGWNRWTKSASDGKYYWCPTTALKTTLALAQADYAAVVASPGTTADPNNLNGGCSGFAWNRMQLQ
ncbi:MAG: hypothetical protein HY042_09685 [Spirochaetia bacterium]|nr:hypothetical protein [Spirochaetia bacterium]